LRRETPRPALAPLAHISASTGDYELDDLAAAARARLARPAVDQEAVLKGAAGAVDVAEVVDRGPLGVDARLERLFDPRA
jgi:hypothetical protein